MKRIYIGYNKALGTVFVNDLYHKCVDKGVNYQGDGRELVSLVAHLSRKYSCKKMEIELDKDFPQGIVSNLENLIRAKGELRKLVFLDGKHTA